MFRLLAFAAALLCCLVTQSVSAQDACPPGELCALRTDDPRCSEGYRCFEFGSFVSGSRASLRRMLEIVNNDIDDPSRHVTIEQVEAANPCSIIFHSEGARPAHNGSCPAYNDTAERVNFDEYSETHPHAGRWPMAHAIYRVPAVPRLTPGEQAEQLATEIENAAINGTAPAPDWFGERHLEAHELINSGELTQAQIEALLSAFDHALVRARTAETAPEAAPAPPAATVAPAADETDMDFSLSETDVPAATVVPASIFENPTFWGFLISILFLGLIIGYAAGNRGKQLAVEKMDRDVREELTSKPAPDAGRITELQTQVADLTAKLAHKQATDAEAKAKVSNDQAFATTFRKHWSEFYSAQDRVARVLNEANIVNLFRDLELVVILEKMWKAHFTSNGRKGKEPPRIDRATLQELFDEAKLLGYVRYHWKPEFGDLTKEAIITVTSDAYKFQSVNTDLVRLKDELISVKAELVTTKDELDRKLKELAEAEEARNDYESRAMQLGSIISTLGLDVEDMVTRLSEDAASLVGVMQGLVTSAVSASAPFIGNLLGENALVPSGAGPIQGSLTRVDSIPSESTAPFAKRPQRPKTNGNGKRDPDRWSSEVPHKPTLPPSAGLFEAAGRYGPKPGMHADGVPPESLKATVEMKPLNPDGTEKKTDAPPPQATQPSAAPGTVNLLDEDDEIPTRQN